MEEGSDGKMRIRDFDTGDKSHLRFAESLFVHHTRRYNKKQSCGTHLGTAGQIYSFRLLEQSCWAIMLFEKAKMCAWKEPRARTEVGRGDRDRTWGALVVAVAMADPTSPIRLSTQ
jgi:hypothetical protein